jgi:hypothetical protein
MIFWSPGGDQEFNRMRDALILVAVHEPELRGNLRTGLQLAGCLAADAANGRETVRTSLLRGTLCDAEAGLGLPARDSEAGLLNLAGIIHESHGRIRSARDFYLRAVCADERYQPALGQPQPPLRVASLPRTDRRRTGRGQVHIADAPARLTQS